MPRKEVVYDVVAWLVQESVVWQVVHASLPDAAQLVLSDVTVFGVVARPAQLLVDGRRWATGDWHHDASTKVCHGTVYHMELEWVRMFSCHFIVLCQCYWLTFYI